MSWFFRDLYAEILFLDSHPCVLWRDYLNETLLLVISRCSFCFPELKKLEIFRKFGHEVIRSDRIDKPKIQF